MNKVAELVTNLDNTAGEVAGIAHLLRQRIAKTGVADKARARAKLAGSHGAGVD